MMSNGIFVTRLIEAAKAAQELGANITLEPDGFAVRGKGQAFLVSFHLVENGIENHLLQQVRRVTA